MAVALKQRDEMLKDRARRQLMESERLALVGRLAADVEKERERSYDDVLSRTSALQSTGAGADSSTAALSQPKAASPRA
jgi:DNA-binding helix-hairpin-helix protein with protein kinase domain